MDELLCLDTTTGKAYPASLVALHYYECHITIDPVPEEGREALAVHLAAFGFRLAKLYMQKGTPHDLDTFCTSRNKFYPVIEANMRKAIDWLQGNGFVVRRFKIEDTLLDSKMGDL